MGLAQRLISICRIQVILPLFDPYCLNGQQKTGFGRFSVGVLFFLYIFVHFFTAGIHYAAAFVYSLVTIFLSVLKVRLYCIVVIQKSYIKDVFGR
jgi:hypothetical protein